MLVAAVCSAATSAARADIRYELRDGHQVLHVRLRLLFGLWSRYWRLPAQGATGLHRSGAFRRQIQKEIVPGRSPHRRPSWDLRSPTWRGADYLRGKVRLRTLEIGMRVGVGDPALSAIGVGLLDAGLWTGIGLLPGYFLLGVGFRPNVTVEPAYHRPLLAAEAGCIADTAFGHLIVAAAWAWVQSWRSRPLRNTQPPESRACPAAGP